METHVTDAGNHTNYYPCDNLWLATDQGYTHPPAGVPGLVWQKLIRWNGYFVGSTSKALLLFMDGPM